MALVFERSFTPLKNITILNTAYISLITHAEPQPELKLCYALRAPVYLRKHDITQILMYVFLLIILKTTLMSSYSSCV